MRVIIIGSGVAGLTAALDLSPQHDVLVLTKADASESNTRYAQGGVAVVTSAEDTPASHVADTLVAGAGLSDVTAATVLCEGGPAAVRELAERGVDFDTTADGRLALGLEAAHEHPRILHVHGDATGEAISTALLRRVAETGVPLRARTTVTDVLVDGGRAVGVRLLDGTELSA
ncbi:MAG TPA: FAD-dependent oxidoreductase, partial [Microlunatus sp.]|nr:FAD-dependent oxidoreductase [Microlunatus sp.]